MTFARKSENVRRVGYEICARRETGGLLIRAVRRTTLRGKTQRRLAWTTQAGTPEPSFGRKCTRLMAYAPHRGPVITDASAPDYSDEVARTVRELRADVLTGNEGSHLARTEWQRRFGAAIDAQDTFGTDHPRATAAAISIRYARRRAISRGTCMRLKVMMTNMLALPLAVAYSEAFPGEEGGTEFAVIVGPVYISFSWG